MAIVQQFQQMGYKSEAVELTAETLTAANYDTSWEDSAVTPEDGYNERRLRRASFAPIQGVGGTALAQISGTFEPRPSGVDGTALTGTTCSRLPAARSPPTSAPGERSRPPAV